MDALSRPLNMDLDTNKRQLAALLEERDRRTTIVAALEPSLAGLDGNRKERRAAAARARKERV